MKNNVLKRQDILLLLLIILPINFLIQYLILKFAQASSPYIFLAYIIFLFIIIISRQHFKNIIVVLLILNFLPLLYLNNDFHYNFTLELLSTAPLLLILFLAISHFFLYSKNFSIKITYLQKPILFFVIYFFISGIIDFFDQKDSFWLTVQLFHISLYLLIFPFYYLLSNRKDYYNILLVLFIIAVVISLEYIYYNLFIVNFRFVTFQSGFLPIVSAILFAYFLFAKKMIKRLGAIFLLSVIVLGTFMTLTRTLWIVTAIVILATFIVYYISQNIISVKRSVVILFLIILPLFIFGDQVILNNKQIKPAESVEYRTKSVANPLEDISFLMRVEVSTYAYNKFLESPIFGKGLGDFVKYIFTVSSNERLFYIDNSWFYFLWKGGIIGLIIYLWLIIRFFKSTYFILRNSDNFQNKFLFLGLIGGFVGILTLGFLSPLLIKYKTNVLIVFLFAYVDFERNRLIKIQTDN